MSWLIERARHEVETLPEPWKGLARINLAIFRASQASHDHRVAMEKEPDPLGRRERRAAMFQAISAVTELSKVRDQYRKQHGIISTSQYRQGP